jgi:hypothetical protein
MALVAVACQHPSPREVAEAPIVPDASPAIDAAPLVEAALPPVPDAAPEPSGDEWLDTEKWAKAHHVKQPPETTGACHEVKLGPSGSDGLFCQMGAPMRSSLPSGHSVFALDVFVVDQGVLKSVLRVPMAAGPMDQEESPQTYYVKLEVALESPTRIVIRDPATNGCSAVQAETKKQQDTRTGSMVSLACTSKGAYTWRNGRFMKDL